MLTREQMRETVSAVALQEREALLRSFFETEARNHRAGMQLMGAGAIAGAFGLIFALIEVLRGQRCPPCISGGGDSDTLVAIAVGFVLVILLAIWSWLLSEKMRRIPDQLIDEVIDFNSRII